MNEARDGATAPAVAWEPPVVAPPAGPGIARSARTRSRIAIAMLAIAGGLGGLAFLHDLTGFGVLDRANAGTLTAADADGFDSAFATIGLLQSIAYLATAIAFLAWLSRSVENVPALGGGTPIVTPRWSIGWWFIPIANLIKPFQVVADLYRRMAPQVVGIGLVMLWWGFWIITNVVTTIAGFLWRNNDLESLRTGLGLWAVSDFGDALTAMLAILVVLQIQDWADHREAAWAAVRANDPGSGLPAVSVPQSSIADAPPLAVATEETGTP